MTFQIYNSNDELVFETNSEACIPSDEAIRQVLKCKYTIKMDGKKYKRLVSKPKVRSDSY